MTNFLVYVYIKHPTFANLSLFRQLFLSRKYSAMWGRKVFGRVLPSTARRHYCTQLQRRQFNIWSQLWWSARREWKLNIRAECHVR